MGDTPPSTIELTCPGCGAYFRLKPKRGKLPKKPIPCPKCETKIPIERASMQSPTETSQSGIISRPAKAKPPEEPDRHRAALEALLDEDKGPNSTFLGFGRNKGGGREEQTLSIDEEILEQARQHSTRKTSENKSVEVPSAPPRGSTTDTSHFLKTDTQEQPPSHEQDDAHEQELGELFSRPAEARETPIQLDKLDFDIAPTQAEVKSSWGDESAQEPGPFDLRDILEAEKEQAGQEVENEITRNPALDRDYPAGAPQEPEQRPLPQDDFFSVVPPREEDNTTAHEDAAPGGVDSGLLSRLKKNLLKKAPAHEKEVTRDNEELVAKLQREARDYFPDESARDTREREALSSHDIFEESSAAADEPLEAPGADEAAQSQSPKPVRPPLAALLKRKLGKANFDDLRGRVEGASEAHEDPAPEEDPLADLLSGADEDDLARVMDEANINSKLWSRPHSITAQTQTAMEEEEPQAPQEDAAAQQPPPEEDVSISKTKLGGFQAVVPRSLKKAPAGEDSAKEPAAPSPLPELPERPAPVLGRLSLHQKRERAQSLLRSLSPPTESEQVGAGEVTVAQESVLEEKPGGISWGGAELHTGDTSGFGRRRRRQESHSGLFPIPGGLGQESSVGMAGERRGSGYIRLPTAEILDVLGQGQYRLMVEDIVYEPVDEVGLTELVKRGVLMGAELIAEPGGEWIPITEHPVFKRLRKKMAFEAHALLSKYKRSDAREQATPSEAGEDAGAAPERDDGIEDFSADLVSEHAISLREQEELAASAPPVPGLAQSSSESEEQEELSEELPSFSPERDDSSISFELPVFQDPSHATDEEEEEQEGSLEESSLEEGSLEEESSEVSEPEQEEPLEVLAQPARVPALTQEIEDPFAHTRKEKKTITPLMIFVLIALIGALLMGGALALNPNLRKALFGTPVIMPAEPDEAGADAKPAVVTTTTGNPEQAISAARQLVLKASALEMASAAGLQRLAAAASSAGDSEGALMLLASAWSPASEQAQTLSYARALEAAGQWGRLRQVAGSVSGSEELTSLRQLAIESDPALRSMDAEPLGSSAYGEAMQALKVGSKVAFTLSLKDEQPAWVFKPAQKGYGEESYKRDVVAWRVCALTACPFRIPETRPARISERDFNKMMELGQGRAASEPSQRYANLAWREDKGSAERYLLGTLRPWVKGSPAFDMDYTRTWRPWTDASADSKVLDEPLETSLAGIKAENPELYASLMAQQGKLSTREMARQISGVIVFDYLFNNRNRFQAREVFNGTDNQFVGGEFVSYEHATAMESRLSSRVRGRFSWVERFSRTQVEALRELDRAEVEPMLFPADSQISSSEQRAFWSRREKLLETVDALIARHGEQAVLAFD